MSKNVRESMMLIATASYIEKIESFANGIELKFTEYQKSCVANAVRTINPLITKNGYAWNNFTVDNIITTLQQVAFLEVNPSATPHECYFIVRNEKNKAGQWNPILEFNLEGAGNDRILLKFGQDVAELKSYIVYDQDEFTEGFMDGWNLTLPKYKRTFITNKPIKVVYLIKKTNGEIDVQYADTLDVMKSLLANAKQNLMNAKDVNENKLLREIAKLGLYDVLEDEKWLDYTITKKGYGSNKDYQAPLFNPSYTSPISMYNMIERKLRNHATRKYPKNFNHKEVSTLYEDTFDEKYNKQGEMITAEEHVEIANTEFEEKTATKPLVKEVKKTKKVEQDDRPALKVEETVEEDMIPISHKIPINPGLIEIEEVEQVVDLKKEFDKKAVKKFTKDTVEGITKLKEEFAKKMEEKAPINLFEDNEKTEKEEPKTEKEVQQSLENDDDDELPDWMN